ncbi:UNVERIFIED_CONTAM: hypothetical protein Scaly_1024700 [Sesamum calycinum]|uniref:Retrotransposon Copia-like N-terminal domain-containing protein n=1 Tax=Sesamum calycinum TaxID=2727403 RepID=A0AAW2QJP5_9LAMI
MPSLATIIGNRAVASPNQVENEQKQLDMDSLQLHSGEHSGMIIVTKPMDSTNYMTWCRSVKLALSAQTKLCFIDSNYDKPSKEDKNYDRWIKVDSMVQTWSLNLISKDIVETNEMTEGMAMNVKCSGKGDYDMANIGNYRRNPIDKKSQFCHHCNKPGHTKETCFKIHGVPDWYKVLVDQRKKEGKNFHTNAAVQNRKSR